MSKLTEDSRTDSLSYRVVTHDRKGREGKGDRKGGDVGHFAYLTSSSDRLPGACHQRPSDTGMRTAANGGGL